MYSFHTPHNRNLIRGKRHYTQVTQSFAFTVNKAQRHLPVNLVGCRHSVGGQCVCVHKVSPFTQVQLEQGPSGCQMEPSSYSTPSNTHAAVRKEKLSYSIDIRKSRTCMCVWRFLPLQIGQHRCGSKIGLEQWTRGHLSVWQMTFPP